ncbi:hypothetical protein AVEN_195694-1 [Araneus ventricosus]|uniref:Uncharacterized protein n=1 Tax=Araneus ventricosus TaxID=182803 RepID=A0A4Y2BBJ6_ARAVE|nr:hypothetical protein AVEN_195694-1 [Araneus ventricosus]
METGRPFRSTSDRIHKVEVFAYPTVERSVVRPGPASARSILGTSNGIPRNQIFACQPCDLGSWDKSQPIRSQKPQPCGDEVSRTDLTVPPGGKMQEFPGRILNPQASMVIVGHGTGQVKFQSIPRGK